MSDNRLAWPAKGFAIAGACLLLLSALTWRSDWPPLDWKLTHVSSAEFGREILMVSILFVLMAFIYFIAPKILGQAMGKKLGQLHFWASLIGFFLLLALPVAFNLAFRLRPGESTFESAFRALGTGIGSSLWAYAAILAAQFFLVANVVSSILTGKTKLGPQDKERPH